tara:strand:- start:906 stop:2270 length:1365 start_codon:yes stop_codon:yes gene_type:complete
MPELNQMLGYPALSDVDSVLELLLWAFFPDAGFANNFGLTAEMFFRKVEVHDMNLNLRILTDAFINTRSDQIDTLGDSIKGIIKMIGPSMELSPTIKFDNQVMNHLRSNWLGLLSNYIGKAFANTRQVIYKLLSSFSSMKMFGNVGGLTEQFIETTKTSAQLARNGYYGRAGCRIGQSFFSGVFRCMGSTAEAGTQLGNSISGYGRNSTFQQSPRHVVHGLGQGLYSGATTVARGLTGIITRPVKGAMEGGVGGAIKGFRQGVVGVVIMIPLAYIGFAERFYKGMGATFQAKGKLSVCGTRRPPRIMRSLRKRKQLKDREREKRMESTHTSQRKQRRSLTIDNHTGKKGSALSSAATDLYLLQQTLKNPTTNKSKSKILNCFNGEGIGDVDQAPEETEIADEEGQAVMQRLFDVDDASLASHVTMRIHKIKNVTISANSKIVVRVNLYTQQSVS